MAITLENQHPGDPLHTRDVEALQLIVDRLQKHDTAEDLTGIELWMAVGSLLAAVGLLSEYRQKYIARINGILSSTN